MKEQKNSQVWGSLRHIFNPAIYDEIQVHEGYLNMDSNQVLEASRIKDGLVGIIQRVQEQAGIRTPLDATQEQRDKFIGVLKNDQQWFGSFSKVLELFNVDADPIEVVKSINRPWWNALQVNLASDNYSPEAGYAFVGKVSHSFIAQLGDAGSKTKDKPRYDVQTQFQPVSVSNVLFTADNKFILGYRGGQNYPDVIMTVPAGSAEPHLKRGAAFGSMDLELIEELKFDRTTYSSAEFVGVATESLLAKGKWHYWLFKTKTPMTSSQVITHWLDAVDRKEHHHLEVYDNNPEKILEVIKTNSWDINKADPQAYSKTTEANKGTWVPQCSISILGSYVQELGLDWAKHAEQELEGHYDLTSCFKK